MTAKRAISGASGSPCPTTAPHSAPPPPPGFLSRFAAIKVWRGNLPHWEKPGVAVFVTFRLGDSLPADKIAPLQEERRIWLDAHPTPWDEESAREYAETFQQRVERWLDSGFGACVFADESCRKVVEGALRHYDGIRYALYSFVVMPNHVHVLLMPHEGHSLSKIVSDIKHFVSRKLSACQTWVGSFWQGEYWDTAIRDEGHFQRVLRYIRENNPRLAYDVYAQG